MNDFIRDLNGIDRVSREWVDAFEAYIPNWITSLIPHYEVAKSVGANVLLLQNVISFGGDTSTKLDVNGVHYYVNENDWRFGKSVCFNANDGYCAANWKDGFDKVYTEPPTLPNGISPALNDWIHYESYTCRYSNQKAPYDELSKRIEAYFQQLINDTTVGINFGSTSCVILDLSKRKAVQCHLKLTA